MKTRYDACVLFGFVAFLSSPLKIQAAGPIDIPPPPLVTSAEHIILYKEDYSHNYRFYRLEDGTWYVRFNTQPTSSHMDPRHPLEQAMISTDDGRTWKKNRLVG